MTSLSTYDFSTLCTILPHNSIKEKLLDLIIGPRGKKRFILPVTIRYPHTIDGINFGLVRMFVTPYRTCIS